MSSSCVCVSVTMLLVVLLCLVSVAASEQQQQQQQQQEDDDWIDPFDMINYDSSSKTMRKPAEPHQRRDYSQESSQPTPCDQKVVDLQKKIEEHERKSQQPTCTPVFRRFLSRVLKDVQRVGVPPDSTDVLYDANIRLSKQAMAEIEAFLQGDDSCRTGALDNAVSQLLVDVRPHDHEAWKWRFEDTFGIDLDTVLKILAVLVLIVVIISTELWSWVSGCMQLTRLFFVSFVVSWVWNWVWLYKIAFAEHQNKMAKLHGISEKCNGLKEFHWTESFPRWFKGFFVHQDDPCQKYFEVLFVNPFLLVAPTKALSVTIVTFITEPMKHVGEGIGDFIRALLKDQPFFVQILMFVALVIIIVVPAYGGVQAAFQYGLTAPFRRPRRDPPPPQLQQQQHQQPLPGVEDLAGGDAPQLGPRPRAIESRLQRNRVRQRRPVRPREEAPKVVVVTLRSGDGVYSADETDARRCEAAQNVTADARIVDGPGAGPDVAADDDRSTSKPAEPDSAQTQTEPPQDDPEKNDEENRDDGASEGDGLKTEPPDAQAEAPPPDETSEFNSLDWFETFPVQESGVGPVSAE